MNSNKKYYFVSDVHLGLPNFEESLKREKLLVQWLDEIKNDAAEIFLVGDLFDFWWEWKRTVPRGFTRFLGKLCELTDAGIPVYYFTGNHDIWVFDYLSQETGVILERNVLIKTINGKKFYITHGDGLGPGDFGYKILKQIFHNSILQWCFSRLHPNFSIGLAQLWSHGSRKRQKRPVYHGADKEWLILHSKSVLQQEHFDFFVYGHRHLPDVIKITENSTYVNLGDWLYSFTYGVFDGQVFEVKSYKQK